MITNEKWEDVNRPELWDAHYKEVMDEFDKIVIPEPIDIHPDNLIWRGIENHCWRFLCFDLDRSQNIPLMLKTIT